jgi:hypothetical protein
VRKNVHLLLLLRKNGNNQWRVDSRSTATICWEQQQQQQQQQQWPSMRQRNNEALSPDGIRTSGYQRPQVQDQADEYGRRPPFQQPCGHSNHYFRKRKCFVIIIISKQLLSGQ